MRHRDTRLFHNYSDSYRSKCELPEANNTEIVSSLQQFLNARNQLSKSAVAVFPAQKRNKPLWILSVVMFLFAAGTTLVSAWLVGRSSVVPVVIQPVSPTSSQVTGLGMRVEVEGGNFRISWNRETAATRFVEEAILQIDESSQHRQLQLDAAQVAGGSILYKPASDDVTFHLEIRARGASRLSQTLRVIDGSKPQADLRGTEKASSPTRVIGKRVGAKSRRHFEPKTMFQATRARLQGPPRTSPKSPGEIAAKPPDIQLAAYPNPAVLPFGPATVAPEYSRVDRRKKFLKVIKHLALPSAKLRESFEP
jgi:hypothetical protein